MGSRNLCEGSFGLTKTGFYDGGWVRARAGLALRTGWLRGQKAQGHSGFRHHKRAR